MILFFFFISISATNIDWMYSCHHEEKMCRCRVVGDIRTSTWGIPQNEPHHMKVCNKKTFLLQCPGGNIPFFFVSALLLDFDLATKNRLIRTLVYLILRLNLDFHVSFQVLLRTSRLSYVCNKCCLLRILGLHPKTAKGCYYHKFK